MKDLNKEIIALKKQQQILDEYKKSYLEHKAKYDDLVIKQQKNRNKYRKTIVIILENIFKKFDIDLYHDKDFYLCIIGFVYAIKNDMLNVEQLKFFKLLGKRYMDKRR